MEIEAKFAITGALDPASLTTLPLHLYTLRSTGVERHSDTLLDTPSRAVTSTRHSLRIRTIGERRIVTLKGPNSGAGGVHERAEVEVELSGPLSFDPRDWPREVGEPALALTRDEPLAPLLRDEVERIRRVATRISWMASASPISSVNRCARRRSRRLRRMVCRTSASSGV